MMETKLVLLGTGTPNACPNASGYKGVHRPSQHVQEIAF